MNWSYVADIIKAMGHPVRLRILSILCEGDENVGDLAREIGTPHASVSQQLAILRMRGLVSRRHEAGHAVYSMKVAGIRDMISCMRRYEAQAHPPASDTSSLSETPVETAVQSNGGTQ